MRIFSPSQESNPHLTYRPDIDGLRAIAILAVVMYHAFPFRVHGGFVGVDIFFVISGYLISSIIFKGLESGKFSFSEFYAKRINRIFPALTLVLLTAFGIGWFVLLPDEFKQLGKHISAGAGFVQNIVLWKEAGYFDNASELKPLVHLWSLAVEEQFYLIFPALMWLVWRFGLNALTVVLIIFLFSFEQSVHDTKFDIVKAYFLPQTRFWELLAGSILAYIQLFKYDGFIGRVKYIVFHPLVFNKPPAIERRRHVLNNILSIVGFFLALAAIFNIDKSKPFPGWWALLPVFGAFLMILAGPDSWVNRKILANRVMVFIGLISYPLYLWHWVILSFLQIMEGETPKAIFRILALLLSFFLAWGTYQFIEKPVRFSKKNSLKIISLSAMMIAVAIIGYGSYRGIVRKSVNLKMEHFLSVANEPFSAWGMPPLRDGVHQEYQDAQCLRKYPNFGEDKACRLQRDVPPTVMIIGDSHANHLFPGLAEYFKGNSKFNILNLSVTGRGWGPPLLNVGHVTGDLSYLPTATNLTNEAISVAENTNSVKVVVMSTFGSAYIPTHKEGEQQLFLAGHPEIKDEKQVWTIGMRDTLSRLLAKGKKVIYVLDSPKLDFSPNVCVDGRPFRLLNHKYERTPCAMERTNFDDANKAYRKLVIDVLKDFPQVKIFDAGSYFCDSRLCWAKKDGEILYRDDHHLSLSGSRFLARQLGPMVTDAFLK
ncbi:acyltransferase family protein [Chromobacterium sp. CV08]|uniref:acyltransferase family protein n=1 Tax=Chromobacterium sp. CV08 TaxID=3133274 RepID=UPI003DA9FAA0